MAATQLALRTTLWPGVSDSELWSRKTAKGFATVPRTLPMIMNIADSFTKNTPVSSVYLDLWCRMRDEGFVKLDKPAEMAMAAGFMTARGPGIWASRLDLLETHGFISLAPGAHGPRSFALLFNPYRVILAKREQIDKRLFNALLDQALAIGVEDLTGPSAEAAGPTLSQISPKKEPG